MWTHWCDLSNQKGLLSMFPAIKAQHEGVDVCINNAGLPTVSLCWVETQEEEKHDQCERASLGYLNLWGIHATEGKECHTPGYWLYCGTTRGAQKIKQWHQSSMYDSWRHRRHSEFAFHHHHHWKGVLKQRTQHRHLVQQLYCTGHQDSTVHPAGELCQVALETKRPWWTFIILAIYFSNGFHGQNREAGESSTPRPIGCWTFYL